MRRWLVRWRLAGLPIDVEVSASSSTEAIDLAASCFGDGALFLDDGDRIGTGAVLTTSGLAPLRALERVSVVAVPLSKAA